MNAERDNNAPEEAGDERFPRERRLLRHSDFQRVYAAGRRQFKENMTVFYLLREPMDDAGPRVGFTVGRVLGKAVNRNRIKRRVRSAVRSNWAALSLPVDVVINPKRSALGADFAALVEEVAQAFATIQANPAAGATPRPRSVDEKKRRGK